MTLKSKLLLAMVLLLFASAIAIGITAITQTTYAAPAGAPTPVSAGIGVGHVTPELITWYDAQSVTADIERCLTIENFEKLDVHSFVDITAVNTTTVNLRYTNKLGLTPVAALALQATVVADGNDMDPAFAMARYGCVLIDVANATPVAITVNALGK